MMFMMITLMINEVYIDNFDKDEDEIDEDDVDNRL